MGLIRPVGRDSLTLNPDVTFRLDVDDFLSRRRLEDYVGGFLPAFSVPGSFEYDQWLEKTRTALRDEYLLQLDAGRPRPPWPRAERRTPSVFAALSPGGAPVRDGVRLSDGAVSG